MNVSLLPVDDTVVSSDEELRICQSCGEVAVLQHHETGVPSVQDGHLTQRCDMLNSYVHTFQPAPFGIVVPQKNSNFIWEFQTNGLICSHRTIRGTYVPLTRPVKHRNEVNSEILNPKDAEIIDVTSLIRKEWYKQNTNKNPNNNLRYLWELLDSELPFTYAKAQAPDGYPSSEEAWKWIQITGLNSDSQSNDVFDPLVGECVVLVYPNSD